MDALKAKPIFPIVSLALATGMRRGELLGLQWGHVDLTACVVKVDRQLTEVGADLAVRKPKTRHGTRTISVPASTIATKIASSSIRSIRLFRQLEF